MVLRLETSMGDFSSIVLTSPCYGDTFSQYSIWSLKDDSIDIVWILSCLFPTNLSCVIVVFFAVSATSASVCSPDCSSLIVI